MDSRFQELLADQLLEPNSRLTEIQMQLSRIEGKFDTQSPSQPPQPPTEPPVVSTPINGQHVPPGLSQTFLMEGRSTKIYNRDTTEDPVIIGSWRDWNVRHLAGNSDDGWKVPIENVTWANTPSGLSLRTAPIKRSEFPNWFQPSDNDLQYWLKAGMFSTEQMFSYTGGYLETKFRINSIPKGHHFAFWLLDDNDNWPPEVDLFETVAGEMNGGMSTNYHWVGEHGGKSDAFTVHQGLSIQDGNWHTIGLNWVPNEKLEFYHSGNLIQSATQGIDQLNSAYILGSWEVSSNWAGNIDPNSNEFGDIEFEYVGVWQ